MATHSSILAWRIPWTEEPGRLQSIVLQSQTQLKQLSIHASFQDTTNSTDLRKKQADLRVSQTNPEVGS